MKLVRSDLVVIPENRFRREFDEKKLAELKESILRNGLLHPIVVERQGEQFVLRAGERRLRAMLAILADNKEIRHGDATGFAIPVTDFAELNERERLEIEVEENTIRSDFTWQERTIALQKLHDLRKLQNPAQSITATASEVLGKPAEGGQVTSVSDKLLLAKNMHIPEVANAKTEKEAMKNLRKIAEAGHNAKLAKAALSITTPHTLIKGDSKDVLPKLQSGSFDVIITDPPYGVDAHQFGDMASTGHDYKDSEKNLEGILSWFCDESFRVAKERAHAYVFCDVRRFDRLAVLMLLAGWQVFPTPLIWSKTNGMLPLPDHGPRRTYECVLYAWKGDRKTLVVKGDVIEVPSVRSLKHGAQKPVALYLDLLSRSARPGDSVLDCFGGTGPVLVAANMMRLTATYVEMAEDSFNIAQLRKDVKEIDDGAEQDDGLGDIPF